MKHSTNTLQLWFNRFLRTHFHTTRTRNIFFSQKFGMLSLHKINNTCGTYFRTLSTLYTKLFLSPIKKTKYYIKICLYLKYLFNVLLFTLLEEKIKILLETINILIKYFYYNYNHTFKIL